VTRSDESAVARAAALDGAPRGALALVLDRTFGTLFWGKLLASAGVWLQGVAAAVVVYQGTGSAAAVALVSIAQSAPQLLLGPWSGSLADRSDPMRQIIVGRALCVAGSGGLAAFFAVTDPGPGALMAVVFTCSFLVGTGFVFGGPAMQSVIPDLVRPDELHTAMTLNTAPMTTARIAGPALGAFMLAWAGPAAAFTLGAATHLIFLALLVFVARLPPRVEDEEPGDLSMRAGLAYLRRRPDLLAMLGATALLGVGTEPSLTLAPALSDALTGDVHLAGPLTLAFGIGALIGLLLSPALARVATLTTAAWTGLLVMITGMGAVALAQTEWLAFACFGLAGAGFSWGMSGFSSLLQAGTDRPFRGRVMAWWLIAFLGCRPLSSAATGLVADLATVHVAFAANAAVLLVCALALGATLWRRSPRT
jgi:predicted MFS family arabinose efflux permease